MITLKTPFIKAALNALIYKKEPVSIVHFLTNRCNARCSFCFIDFENPEIFKKELSLNEIEKLTKNLGSSILNVNFTGGEPFARKDIQEIADFDDREKLGYEKQLMGVFVSGHPLDRFKDVIKQLSSMEISTLMDMTGSDKREVTLAGMITGRKNILTKKGDKMCFATLEDLSGKLECIVFPRTFAEYEEILSSDEPLVMKGFSNLNEEPRKFFPEKILKLRDQAEERVTGVRINVKIDELNQKRLERFKQVLLSYRGTVPLDVIFESEEGRARLPLGQEFLVNPTPQMAAKINEVFQSNSVKFIVDGRIEEVQFN